MIITKAPNPDYRHDSAPMQVAKQITHDVIALKEELCSVQTNGIVAKSAQITKPENQQGANGPGRFKSDHPTSQFIPFCRNG
jgi:hypothetical protein